MKNIYHFKPDAQLSSPVVLFTVLVFFTSLELLLHFLGSILHLSPDLIQQNNEDSLRERPPD